MTKLEELRVEIDKKDDELIKLFSKRMYLSGKIAEYKKLNKLPISDKGRENEKLGYIAEKTDKELREYTTSLYETIFSISKDYQERLCW